VGNQDHRHPALALLALQQVEDLPLHRDVERGRGLVGDQELGCAGNRDGDGHALPHAARQFVRILSRPPLSLRDADFRQQFDGADGGRPGIEPAIQLQALADLAADLHHGIERGHRVLEDDPDVATQHAAEFPGRQRPQVAALEQDLAPYLGSRACTYQPDQRAHQYGFPRTRFSHDAEGLTLVEVERNAVDGAQRPARREEADPRLAHRQERRAAHSADLRGSTMLRTMSPTKFSDRTVANITAAGISAV
jgi:hypothetical protein